jgi:hypothetical protein
MEDLKVILLDETKKAIERDVGLTLEQMNNMDLGDIEKHIHQKKGYVPMHIPRLYRRCRDWMSNQGRFLTKEDHERNVQYLIKKYL